MKYYILVTSILLTSANVIITMEPEACKKTIAQKIKSSKPNNSYYSDIDQVKAAAEGKPSITLINNDTDELLHINMGNAKKYGTSCSFPLHKATQMTLCPYLFPNSLDTRQIQNGAMITLNLYTNRLHCFVPYINGNPSINIKKGMFVHYIEDKNKVYIIHNAKQIKNGIILTLVNPLKNNTREFTLHIGGNATVQFGDRIRIDTSNNKIHIIHNDTKTLETFPITNHTIHIDHTKAITRRHTL